MRSLALALLSLTFAHPALAADGVLEINQTCAVDAGCFSGDAAGFPVTIGGSGSYRLTGNLLIPDADTNAIEIGVGESNNAGHGIHLAGGGSVVGSRAVGNGSHGISTLRSLGGVIVRDSHSSHNAGDGIRLLTGGSAIGNVASDNGGVGLSAGGNGISFNLDFTSVCSLPTTYGGAAGQTGTWVDIPLGGT